MLILETPQTEIWRFYAHNSLRNYSYALRDKATHQALVIDPWDGEEILHFGRAKGWRWTALLNTHQHADHTRGNEAFLRAGVPLQREALGLCAHGCPGHTAEHVVYHWREGEAEGWFLGDTLFQAGVGNCKNGGDPQVLYRSLQQLRSWLRPRAWLWVGHDYAAKNLDFAESVGVHPSALREARARLRGRDGFQSPAWTWEQELAVNPFLNLAGVDVRQVGDAAPGGLREQEWDDEMLFVRLRSLRDRF